MEYSFTFREKDKGVQLILSYKDKTGRWKQKSKQGFATKGEAKKYQDILLDSVKEEMENNTPEELKDITLKQLKEMYLADSVQLRKNSVVAFNTAYKRFIQYNDIPVVSISYFTISQTISELKNLNPNTFNGYINHMKRLFKHAVKPLKIIKENPFDDIKPMKSVKSKRKALNKAQYEQLFSALHQKNYNHYMIAVISLYTGLRYSEALGLTWDCVDLKNKEMTIEKQWTLDGFGPLKTENSYRTIPIPDELLNILIHHKKMAIFTLDRRVCFPYKGTSATAFNNSCKKITGLNMSHHWLRHTYGTSLLAKGFDLCSVAALLGDTVETVSKTYLHFTDDLRAEAKKSIENVF